MSSPSSSLPPNLFTAPPTPPPPSLTPHPPTSLNLPPLPPRRRRPNNVNFPNPNPSHAPQPQGGSLPPRRSPHYRKPIRDAADSPSVLPVDSHASGRAVVVGPSGVGFRLPGAPFDFQYSYSEIPRAAPIAIREPAVLPFAAPTMPRPWTGKAPLLSKKEKAAKKGLRLFRPLGHDDSAVQQEDGGIVLETRGRRPLQEHLGMRFMVPSEEAMKGRSREEVLGAPLCNSEIANLVRPHVSHNRQLNIGMTE